MSELALMPAAVHPRYYCIESSGGWFARKLKGSRAPVVDDPASTHTWNVG